ncbi:MAG: hypothetical protein AUI97_05955 [Crenarchaeota archaeon 13_1_40CM_3_52_17]|nr:MAG: hypothetical protein AUI97_05955 [Crenarchaeota archaeon 13_1_40CM_3_52_17]
MRNISSAKLLIIFAIAFSLTTLAPSLAGTLPRVNVARADSLTSHVPWYPAGPVTDSLTYSIFADETAEFQGLAAHTIDFTDWPLSPDLVAGFQADPTIWVSQTIPDTGYFELQFHMGNNFWGCQFNYGNPATQTAPLTTNCGMNIRQAFAHGLDKNRFITTELQGLATPIDNPVPPPSIDLNTPDPCAWDPLFPQTGSACHVNALGGTAYHLATAAAGSGCTNTPGFQYTPGCGQPDFCAAADHLIAAGLATGKGANCALTGVQLATINAHPVQLFVRSDNTPRLHAGQSYAQFLCALFTGTFSTGCGSGGSTNNIVNYTPGPITSFPGFTTNIGSTALTWWVYTAGFGNVLTADSSLYFGYNSQFVSGYPAIETSSPGGHCSTSALASFAPGNYMYVCNQSYDTLTTNAEFAACTSVTGDPVTSQINNTAGNTVTFGTCSDGRLSQASAFYQSQYVYGKNAYTIPWWSGQNLFAYQHSWDRGALNAGDGFTPPGNFFTTLDARNPTGATICGNGFACIRQGYKQSSGSANPFIGNTVWDAGVIGSIYDGPGATNPDVPSSYMEWMTLGTAQIPAAQLGYAPPAGTVAGFRYQLRHDIFWQFASSSTPSVPGSLGDPVTAWDIAFSYIAYRANGVAGGLAPMTGIHVVSPSQIDILVNAVGPNTKLFLSNTVIPARSWTATCPGTLSTAAANWDAYANQGLSATSPAAFHAADNSITPCIAPSGSVDVLSGGAGNIIRPTGSSVDSAKVAPSYDVDTAANLIGSGPWVCASSGTIGGPGCSSSGNSAPPTGGSWTFVRYGQGQTPGASLKTYFRSSGNLALWVWSQNTGDFAHDGQLFSILASCVNVTPVPTKCNGWSMGIGNGAGTNASPATITSTQVSIVFRFQGVNWVSPFDWRALPPQNIGTFPPVLYEGTATLNPSSVAGCTTPYSSGGGYDC